ncbi:MAG: FAD:protein FMN transferase [Candidatus Neomarinimicrobiota bacterium]|nr:MAG: FAD:protein FMN transferase [Candidatus Neomarinimicrobiota bacterium]
MFASQIVLGILVLFFGIGCSQNKEYVEFTGKTMGTMYNIRIVPDQNMNWKLEEAQIKIDSILLEIDQQMSTYKWNSEISLFNQAKINEKIKISSGFQKVLEQALYWGKKTNGALDVSVMPSILTWRKGFVDSFESEWKPPLINDIVSAKDKVDYAKVLLRGNILIKVIDGQMIDLSAIAKGWGVDQLFELFWNLGVTNLMVEVGGEVRTMGTNIKKENWKIGIDTPIFDSVPGENIFKVAVLKIKAIATSGNYRNFYTFNDKRFSHIIDPRTGYPVETNIASVTVLGPNSMDTDALATALSVLNFKRGKR